MADCDDRGEKGEEGDGVKEGNVLNFLEEARQVLGEVSYAIQGGALSSALSCSRECVYFNLTTREGRRFCIRLTISGFEVVGEDYDSLAMEDSTDTPAFETIYSLLDHISPSYRQSFSNALSNKLDQLQQGPSDIPS